MTLKELQDHGYKITEREYMALNKDVTKELKAALETARVKLRQLFDKLEGVKPEDYYVTAVKFKRLATLEKDLIKAYTDAARKSGTIIQYASKVAISNSYYRQQFATKLGTSVLDNVNYVFSTLPEAVVQTSVYGTVAKFNDKFGKPNDYVAKSGTLLEAVLDKNRQADINKIRTAVTQALTNGEGYQKASGRIKKILDTTATNAQRIIRTEGHRNQLAGQFAMVQDAKAQGVKMVRQIDSVLDDRTRPQSVEVDGIQEDEDGYFHYPGGVLVKVPGNSGVAAWDLNDRESVINIIDGVEPTTRRARDPVTGETDLISFKNFDEWAKENGLTRNRYGQLLPVK